MTTTVRFLGTTDDVTSCDCCGKQHLKSTVALSIDDGDPLYYGVVCAARALKRTAKEIRSESSKADREKADKEAAERHAAWQRSNEPWFDFLRAHGTGADAFTQIESLGGYAAAQKLYKESRV